MTRRQRRAAWGSRAPANEGENRPWLARFDGAKWAVEQAPSSDTIDHIDELIVKPDGTLVAITWPSMFERGPSGWSPIPVEAELAKDFKPETIWYGKDRELWMAGDLSEGSGRVAVVLHRATPPQMIWNVPE